MRFENIEVPNEHCFRTTRVGFVYRVGKKLGCRDCRENPLEFSSYYSGYNKSVLPPLVNCVNVEQYKRVPYWTHNRPSVGFGWVGYSWIDVLAWGVGKTLVGFGDKKNYIWFSC